jgi:hypothetical protein
MLVVKFADDAHPLAEYGFEPLLTNPGVIRVNIKKSKGGEYGFEGGIAWDPRGKRLAVVTATPTGGRVLTVLNRQMGQAAETGTGGVDLRQRLPLAGQIRSVAFTSDTHIRIVGSTQQFDLDIPAQGKIPNDGAAVLSEALPRTLNVNLATGVKQMEVIDWVCK